MAKDIASISKLNRSVIYINASKFDYPTEFNYCMNSDLSMNEAQLKPYNYERVIYLGNDPDMGYDMFAAYLPGGVIPTFYLGKLNSGRF